MLYTSIDIHKWAPDINENVIICSPVFRLKSTQPPETQSDWDRTMIETEKEMERAVWVRKINLLHYSHWPSQKKIKSTLLPPPNIDFNNTEMRARVKWAERRDNRHRKNDGEKNIIFSITFLFSRSQTYYRPTKKLLNIYWHVHFWFLYGQPFSWTME